MYDLIIQKTMKRRVDISKNLYRELRLLKRSKVYLSKQASEFHIGSRCGDSMTVTSVNRRVSIF